QPDVRRYHELPDERIDELLREDFAKAPKDLRVRVGLVSERFLGTPYRQGPLGEGPDGGFDRKPLISFQEADCTTFIEHVMAMAIEGDRRRAKATLQKIRYKNGEVRYESRNHFPELDWIPNNISAGYLRDITREVAGDKARSVSRTVSKSRWYA